MHLINVLARFDRPRRESGAAGAASRREQARAAGCPRRHRAVEDQGRHSSRRDLLLDPDLDVMNKAVEVIVQLNDPETAKYLIPALKSENEFSRRVRRGNPERDRHDAQRQIPARGRRRRGLVGTFARLRRARANRRTTRRRRRARPIKDKDENIRRAAIEILNTCRDKRAVDRLIEATRDKDWWVSERAADALAEIGDAKALPALLEMVAKNDRVAARRAAAPSASSATTRCSTRSCRTCSAPRRRCGSPRSRPSRSWRASSRRKSCAPTSSKQPRAPTKPSSRAATKALQKLDGKLSPSGRFVGTATVAGRHERRELHDIAADARRRGHAPTRRRLAPPPHAATSTARTLLVEGPEDAAAAPPAPEAPSFDLSALQPGDLIEGRYKFIQKIGKGAFGTVVLVEDTVVEERLILKFLNANVASDEEMLKRFVHELRYSRRITHKNVIRIYDFLYVGGGYAISMEYFPVAHARHGDRQREADAAEQGRAVRRSTSARA